MFVLNYCLLLGLTQGFLPSNILNPIGDEDLKPTHAYDDVAKEEVSETESKTMENETEIKENTDESNPESESSGNNSQQKSQVPVRKAPPVPPQKHPSDQQSNHSYEEIAASEVASEVNFLYTHFIFVLTKNCKHSFLSKSFK